MVKRKYLAASVIFIFSMLYQHQAIASAYLPESRTYKYYMGFMISDKTSRKQVHRRLVLFEQIQDKIYSLGILKSEIIKKAADDNRNLRNSEKRKIELLDADIARLIKDAKKLSSFTDDRLFSMEIEYGFADKYSLGLKLDYSVDKFAKMSNHKLQRTTYKGNGIGVFYKSPLYDQNNIIITFRPKFYHWRYDDNNFIYLDMGVFTAVSRKSKKHTRIQELGITARKYYGKGINSQIGYTISALDAFKFQNGVMLSNYTEYEKRKVSNFLYSSTLFTQITLAKEIILNSFKVSNFNVQAGYFWKQSTVDKSYIISGPICSLWFNL